MPPELPEPSEPERPAPWARHEKRGRDRAELARRFRRSGWVGIAYAIVAAGIIIVSRFYGQSAPAWVYVMLTLGLLLTLIANTAQRLWDALDDAEFDRARGRVARLEERRWARWIMGPRRRKR